MEPLAQLRRHEPLEFAVVGFGPLRENGFDDILKAFEAL